MHTNSLWHLVFKKKYSLLAASSIALSFFSAALEGLSFVAVLAALNTSEHFAFFVLAAFLAQLIRSTASYLGMALASKLTSKLQVEVQSAIYAKVLRLSYSQVSSFKMGDLIEYATSPPHFFPRLSEWSQRLFISSLMVVVYVVFMLTLSSTLTLGILALFGVAAFFQRYLLRKIVHYSHKHAENLAHLNKETAQFFEGMQTVHLFDRGKQALALLSERLHAIGRSSLRLGLWNQLSFPIYEGVTLFLVAGALILGQFLLGERGSLLLIFLALTYRLGTRLQIVLSAISEIAFQFGPLRRLQTILKTEEREEVCGLVEACFTQKLSFDQVSFAYPEKEELALDAMSFSLAKGEMIAFIGPSGAGKSTLLSLLLRLYSPLSGVITLDGRPASDFSLSSWRSLFGVVSQEVFLFHDTVAANLRFGCSHATQEELERAAHFAGAASFIEALPKGYATVVGERGYRLSGGERQRLSLARALVRKPEILVLDEATSHLDMQTERLIQEALEKLKGKMTMIVVAHRLSTIEGADRVYDLGLNKECKSGLNGQ